MTTKLEGRLGPGHVLGLGVRALVVGPIKNTFFVASLSICDNIFSHLTKPSCLPKDQILYFCGTHPQCTKLGKNFIIDTKCFFFPSLNQIDPKARYIMQLTCYIIMDKTFLDILSILFHICLYFFIFCVKSLLLENHHFSGYLSPSHTPSNFVWISGTDLDI